MSEISKLRSTNWILTQYCYDEEQNMEKSRKKLEICNHCGGTLRSDGEDVKCLMCGRSAGHHCELCMIHPEKEKKHQRKSTASAGKHRS